MDTDQYTFALHVEQQPQRARMCGFGDRDRRPITPPPCVRLSIKDKRTGQEVEVSSLDISFFVLTVDLWDEFAQNELNLVVHPTSAGQSTNRFSAVSSVPVNDGNTQPYGAWEGDDRQQAASQPYGYGLSSDYPAYFPAQNKHYDEQKSRLDYQQPHGSSLLPSGTHFDLDRNHHNHTGQNQSAQPRNSATQHAPGSFTRNLIGSLVASAFKLHDTKERLGVWFVLQDLSVRTEGTFRLKFSFVNLSTGSHSLLTSGSTPVLCSGFSNPFNVYSAKRFPGMIESTDISRKFSNQGIKIPVRKSDG